ncbi:hypothetical protein ACVILK_003212 [Bradyrhizobium embrapense]
MIWDVEQAHGFEHQGVGDVVKSQRPSRRKPSRNRQTWRLRDN